MTSVVKLLKNNNLINPPNFVVSGLQYEVITGSVAYGVTGESSDWDVYGFCIPPKDTLWPHLRGEIEGFSTKENRFEQWSEHHIFNKNNGRTYDCSIYNIAKFFRLVMDNNPNMIDCLFVPRRCVLFSTPVAEHVRTHRKEFLHKGSWHKFKGYAYSQMAKIRNKTNSSNPKRADDIKKHGYDTKFAMHLVRLMCEVEQILTEGDLDLERNREQLKKVREGLHSFEEIQKWFSDKERSLESAYIDSRLPYKADEERIRQILMECLESHYGSEDTPRAGSPNLLDEIQQLLDKHRLVR